MESKHSNRPTKRLCHISPIFGFRDKLFYFFIFCFDSMGKFCSFENLRLTKQNIFQRETKDQLLETGALHQNRFHICAKESRFQFSTSFYWVYNEFSMRTRIPFQKIYSRHMAIGRVNNIYGLVMGIGSCIVSNCFVLV